MKIFLKRMLPVAAVLILTTIWSGAMVFGQGSYKGNETSVRIDKMPATAEEFIALRDEKATTPEGGAAVFVVALLKYAEDEKLGQDFLTIAIDQKWLMDKNDGYKGKAPGVRYMQALKMRIHDKPYVARSYVQGTSPDNGYELKFPITIKILEQDGDKAANAKRKSENGLYKLFVYSTGADRPRPIEVNQNDKGLWKAYNWGSLEAGVRPPVETTSDDI